LAHPTEASGTVPEAFFFQSVDREFQKIGSIRPKKRIIRTVNLFETRVMPENTPLFYLYN